MKRLGGVYDELCSYGNLLKAFGSVRRGKRYRRDIQEYAENLSTNLNRLADELAACDFHLGDYHYFTVYEPKERKIFAAAIRERVIHHAIINVCGECLENALIDDSYACIKGRGHLPAVRRAQQFAKQYDWCLKLDIKSYFDSIDHELLFTFLTRKFKDKRLLALFSALLDSYCTLPGKGLPIGNLTSQYFANLYLDVFDRWAGQRKGFSYLRYMDDMLVFGDHDDLKELWRQCPAFLDDNLRLTLKHGGSLQRLSQGVDFLGYRIYPHYMLLNQRSKRRFRKKIKYLETMLEDDSISLEETQCRAKALCSFIDHADSYHFKQSVLKGGRLTG